MYIRTCTFVLYHIRPSLTLLVMVPKIRVGGTGRGAGAD
jgi:hypothetical protein